jgi:hypothetical protein
LRALVIGWFSWSKAHATAGDLIARDVVCRWLADAGCEFDVAVDPPFTGGIDWRTTRAEDYTHVIFVCGPFQRGKPEDDFFRHFQGPKLIGIDLSMLVPLEEWQPFDVLFERDSTAFARPDIAFLSNKPLVPVVGRCLVEPYARSFHAEAADAIGELLSRRECSIVEIDTRLDVNLVGLRTPAEVESLIARVDVLVTSRLHGMVLALKNGVPVVAVDPMGDGVKILRQAKTIGWPFAFAGDDIDPAKLQEAYDFCLRPEARVLAAECRSRAYKLLENSERELLEAVSDAPAG